MASMDSDAEDFLSRVQDVSRLVDGLANNKLSPDYVTKRTKELGLDDVDDVENEKNSYPLLKQSNGGLDVNNTKNESRESVGESERLRDAEIKLKVKELQDRRNQRLRASLPSVMLIRSLNFF